MHIYVYIGTHTETRWRATGLLPQTCLWLLRPQTYRHAYKGKTCHACDTSKDVPLKGSSLKKGKTLNKGKTGTESSYPGGHHSKSSRSLLLLSRSLLPLTDGGMITTIVRT